MEWKELSKIPKFSPLQQVFSKFGAPKFRLGTRPVYYMGEGFLISFSDRQFVVEGLERKEYGDIGEYALSIYFFPKAKELWTHFKLTSECFEFDTTNLLPFEIVDGIKVLSKYKDVQIQLRPSVSSTYYQEGETRSFTNGTFSFQNNFIQYGNFTFFFFGRAKQTPLSAFEYTLVETD